MARLLLGFVLLTVACSYKPLDPLCTDQMPSSANCVRGDGGCVGLECNIADCQAMGMSPTTISGTVFAPNGTLPLYGVSVYVPNADPGAFKPGVQCGSC